MKAEINVLNSNLIAKIELRENPMLYDTDVVQAEISKIRKQIKEKKRKLKYRENDANSQRVKRVKFKETIKKICEKDEETGKMLKTFNRKVKGRPRVEVDQPGLLSTIVDIVDLDSATDARRRCEMLRTCTTLDDLCKKLEDLGFIICRSAVYLRLMPRQCNSLEGLRHVETVPVKLLRPENSLRYKRHFTL